jgi:hypothetical protein
MTKEALKLALEALESCDAAHITDGGRQWYDEKLVDKAITAIKEALANEALDKMAENARELGLDYEPAQDGECKYCTDGCPACDARKLPEQEPVAWIWEKEDGYTSIETHSLDDEDMKNVGVKSIKPLYAKPQFIGLTEDEILLISAECAFSHQHMDIHFARAIEAKLRSKYESKN